MNFPIPQPDDTITVTTESPSTVMGRDKNINTYKQVLVTRSENWEGPNSFRVRDPSARSGIRVINISSVTKLNINNFNVKPSKTNQPDQIITLKGSKGNEYSVRVHNGKGVSCTCTGYKFRRNCRHLEEVVKEC